MPHESVCKMGMKDEIPHPNDVVLQFSISTFTDLPTENQMDFPTESLSPTNQNVLVLYWTGVPHNVTPEQETVVAL